MSKLSDNQNGLLSLYAFRKQMGRKLLTSVVSEYWNPDSINDFTQKLKSVGESDIFESSAVEFDTIISYVNNKLSVASIFQKLGIVKYIGISGSVAANFYKAGDDIDLFIVVGNNWSWVYRGILKLLLTLNGVSRNFKDKQFDKALCLNYIVEERGIKVSESTFYMHELLHCVSAYDSSYKKQLIGANRWLVSCIDQGFLVNKPISLLKIILSVILGLILLPINALAFLFQLLFMITLGHRPEYSRLFKNFILGKIAFYPNNFRAEKESEFTKEYEKLVALLSKD